MTSNLPPNYLALPSLISHCVVILTYERYIALLRIESVHIFNLSLTFLSQDFLHPLMT